MESTGEERCPRRGAPRGSGIRQLDAAARTVLSPAALAGPSWVPGTAVKQGLATLPVPASACSSFHRAGQGLGMMFVGLFLLFSVSGLKEMK